MAKKRGYNVDEIKTEYERSLNQQEQRAAIENGTAKEDEQPEINEKAAIDTHVATEREEPYVDPDYEDYKRISLFMDFETWERIQAVCWKEKSAVNKLLVEHLREWSLKLPESDVDEYRHFKEEQNVKEWAKLRDVMIYWWRTSGIREQLNIKSYRIHRNGTMTVIEMNGTIHEFTFLRGWITDGKNKYMRVKAIEAQLRRG